MHPMLSLERMADPILLATRYEWYEIYTIFIIK